MARPPSRVACWENSRHLIWRRYHWFPTSSPGRGWLVSPPNDVWETSAEIPYWWRVTTEIFRFFPRYPEVIYREVFCTLKHHNPSFEKKYDLIIELFCLSIIEFYFKKGNFEDNFSAKIEVSGWMKTNMAASSCHPLILSPKYGQTGNVKPLFVGKTVSINCLRYYSECCKPFSFCHVHKQFDSKHNSSFCVFYCVRRRRTLTSWVSLEIPRIAFWMPCDFMVWAPFLDRLVHFASMSCVQISLSLFFYRKSSILR